MFFSFAFLSIAPLTRFINKPDSYRNLTIFIIFSISLFNAVNSSDIKITLVNGLSTFLINAKPSFSNSPKGLSRNPTYYIILEYCVLEIFILADNLFGISLFKSRILTICHKLFVRKISFLNCINNSTWW